MIVETIRALIRLLRANFFENVVLSAGNIVELTELPAIILNGPTMSEKKRLMRDPERLLVIDEENAQAIYEMPPRWYDLRFDVNVSCQGNIKLIEILENFSRVNQKYPLLNAVNDDRERYYSWSWNALLSAIDPNISQVYQGRGELIIYDVEVYNNIREIWPLISKIKAEFNPNEMKDESLEVS